MKNHTLILRMLSVNLPLSFLWQEYVYVCKKNIIIIILQILSVRALFSCDKRGCVQSPPCGPGSLILLDLHILQLQVSPMLHCIVRVRFYRQHQLAGTTYHSIIFIFSFFLPLPMVGLGGWKLCRVWSLDRQWNNWLPLCTNIMLFYMIRILCSSSCKDVTTTNHGLCKQNMVVIEKKMWHAFCFGLFFSQNKLNKISYKYFF